MKLLLSAIFSFLLIFTAFAQNEAQYPKGKKGYEETYNRNIKKSRIAGVYIPKDIHEAIQELDALSPDGAKVKFTNAPEEVIATKLHFGLGRWISVFWNFEEGSRYVEYLRNLGITDPDHMIQFTIVSYHRYKNGRELDIDKQVAHYKSEREKFLLEYRSNINEISSESRPVKKGN
ncbi:MAG: hypothetical protein ACJA1A_002491 [Saprospiraceae bacterium]|jgi:hypothetical protein|tara:strand:- start:281 stop:808 length:528 start_codon:yes stop_codon:yes gene_type:complete